MARQMNRWSGIPFVALRFSNIMEPHDYERFPSFRNDPMLRKWNLWGYVDARDVAQSCRLGLEADIKGAESFIIAAGDTCMNRTNRELMAEVFPGVPLRDGIGDHDTLLSVDKAHQAARLHTGILVAQIDGLGVRLTRRDLLLLILAFLITRAAITAAGVLALKVLPSNEGSEFTHLLDGGRGAGYVVSLGCGLLHVDCHLRLRLAQRAQPADDMAFLPLYPLAIHLVSGMTPTGCLASPYLSTCATVGGLVVSNAALLTRDASAVRSGAGGISAKRAAWRAALLLLVSPISIFLSGAYTEALFLLLSLLTFWLLERDRFGLAVLAAALACLTRSVGVALFLPLLWVAWNGGRLPLTPSPLPHKRRERRRTKAKGAQPCAPTTPRNMVRRRRARHASPLQRFWRLCRRCCSPAISCWRG